MVARAGSLATIDCEPRQARKGATVAEDSGAEVSLVRAAANRYGCTLSVAVTCQPVARWDKSSTYA